MTSPVAASSVALDNNQKRPRAIKIAGGMDQRSCHSMTTIHAIRVTGDEFCDRAIDAREAF